MLRCIFAICRLARRASRYWLWRAFCWRPFFIKSGGDRVGGWMLLLQAGDCAAARAVYLGSSSSGMHIYF